MLRSLSARGDVKHLTVDADTRVTVSNSLQTCFLVILGGLLTILTNCLSTADDSSCFLSACGGDTIVPRTYTCKLLFSQLIFGSVAALK